MKFGLHFEIWSTFGYFVWFGMVWYVGRGYVSQNMLTVNQSVSQSVTKVGIELLGQLKTDNLVAESFP